MGEVKEMESARMGTYYPVDAELGARGAYFLHTFCYELISACPASKIFQAFYNNFIVFSDG
jgi:hypothetical protein